jgi:acetoin utilization deacetylase AcuC-like enzyme
MAKFGRLYEVLVRDGIAALDQFHCSEPAPTAIIKQAHAPAYVDAYLSGTLGAKEMRRIGFPWSPQLAYRTCAALGSTLLAAELALAQGLACSTAGGTHHAYYDFGSGFCIFNDLAITVRALLAAGRVQQVLIVDLDVHQGDGTASMLQTEPRAFTFSMHCGANFPVRKQCSSLDVDLAVGMQDDEYLRILAGYLPDLLRQVKPDLVLYDAGVDPHKADLLGKLALTDAGLYRRDVFVLRQCAAERVPVACVIGGGYSRDIDALARRHALVHRAAMDVGAAF